MKTKHSLWLNMRGLAMRTGRSKTSCEANKIGLAMRTGRSKTSCEAMRGFAMKTKHSIRLNMRGFAMILRQAQDNYFKCGLSQSGQAPSASSGQALIIMLLVMAAAITLGLAASRQVTTDIRVSTQQQESAKAYSAAEAGIERALSGDDETVISVDTNVTASVEKITLGETSQMIWPHVLNPGEGMFLWLAGHDANGDLDFADRFNGQIWAYFTKAESDQADEPAIFYSIYYDDGNSVDYSASVASALDPVSARRSTNGFSVPAAYGSTLTDTKLSMTKTFDYRGYTTRFEAPNHPNPVFIYLKVLYAPAYIGFSAANDLLPAQGHLYTSTGQVAPAEAPSVISRKIQALTTFDQPPQVLLEPLTTLGNLVVTGN